MDYQFYSLFCGPGLAERKQIFEENKDITGVYGGSSVAFAVAPCSFEVGTYSKVWVSPSQGEIGASLCLHPSPLSGVIRSSQPESTEV
jgi:hypothetical protein